MLYIHKLHWYIRYVHTYIYRGNIARPGPRPRLAGLGGPHLVHTLGRLIGTPRLIGRPTSVSKACTNDARRRCEGGLSRPTHTVKGHSHGGFGGGGGLPCHCASRSSSGPAFGWTRRPITGRCTGRHSATDATDRCAVDRDRMIAGRRGGVLSISRDRVSVSSMYTLRYCRILDVWKWQPAKRTMGRRCAVHAYPRYIRDCIKFPTAMLSRYPPSVPSSHAYIR